MKIAFLVLINKMVTLGCKMFKKNGTQLPGHIVYDWFSKKVLTYVTYPKIVIAVTGSSGKGTTCGLIKHILEDSGYSVAFNETGSNGVLGATTVILNNCDFKGKFNKDVLLLECDERHLKLIFTKNKPTHLVITNVTRDQPARNGTPEIVFNDIMRSVNVSVHLVVNADDPLVNRVSLLHKGKITTYGISKVKGDVIKPALNNVDFAYCPKCHKKLDYLYYHYGHLGNYKCNNCGYARGEVDYEASNVNLEKQEIMINEKEYNINKNAIYTVYAELAAYSVCKEIGISNEDLDYALNKDSISSKRGKSYKIDDRDIMMLETKNENNLSYYQSCKYISEQSGKKTVILGFENVSRRYKDNDLSWLYDVNFELLNDKNIDKIFCIGRFRYDVATRLSYANIESDKVILVDDLNNLINIVKKRSNGNIYTMVCFDMTAIIKKLIKEDTNAD